MNGCALQPRSRMSSDIVAGQQQVGDFELAAVPTAPTHCNMPEQPFCLAPLSGEPLTSVSSRIMVLGVRRCCNWSYVSADPMVWPPCVSTISITLGNVFKWGTARLVAEKVPAGELLQQQTRR